MSVIRICFCLIILLEVSSAFMLTSPLDRTKFGLNSKPEVSTSRIMGYNKYFTVSNFLSLGSNIDDEQLDKLGKSSMIRKIVSNISPKLALLPFLLFITSPKIAHGMGPNLRGPVVQEELKGMELAKMMAQRRMARELAEQKKMEEEEGNKIYREKGSKAYDEYMKKCEKENKARSKKKAEERVELLEGLVEEGIDPFRSLRGKAIVFAFDTGVDLYTVPGTEQEAFDKLRKVFPEKYGNVEERQISTTKEKVQELKEEGMTIKEIVLYFEKQAEKYDRLGSQRGRDLDRLQAMREKKSSGKNKKSINQKSQTPLVTQQLQSSSLQPKAEIEQKAETIETEQDVKAVQLKAKQEAKAEKAKAKEEAKAAKLKAKQEAKAEKAKAKEEAKAAKLKAKEEAKAAKIAATTAAAAAAAAAAASSSLPNIAAPELNLGEGSSQVVEKNEELSGEETKTTEGNGNIDIAEPSIVSSPSSESDVRSFKIPKIVAATSIVGASGYFSLNFIRERNKKSEEERKRQFDLLMGSNTSPIQPSATPIQPSVTQVQPSVTPVQPSVTPTQAPPSLQSDDNDDSIMDIVTPKPQFLADTPKDKGRISTPQITTQESSITSASSTPKKKKRSIANIFKKNSSSRAKNLDSYFESTSAPQFASVLSKILTFGAPGRFPEISVPPELSKDSAVSVLLETRSKCGLSGEEAAEVFANIVNCMLIKMIDLASSTLGEGNDKVVVEGMNVVLDFMDYGAQLYEEIVGDVTITPVTYDGSLSKSKLENLFTTYSTTAMTDIENADQDRLEILQRVLNISDKRAEGLMQKMLMKNLMKMMKDGGKGGDGEGLEGMAQMMSELTGGSGALPDTAEISPEEMKQSIQMMKELIGSGSISKEEVQMVKDQFKQAYGSDLSELIKAADKEDAADELGEDGRELLGLFKEVLKE